MSGCSFMKFFYSVRTMKQDCLFSFLFPKHPFSEDSVPSPSDQTTRPANTFVLPGSTPSWRCFGSLTLIVLHQVLWALGSRHLLQCNWCMDDLSSETPADGPRVGTSRTLGCFLEHPAHGTRFLENVYNYSIMNSSLGPRYNSQSVFVKHVCRYLFILLLKVL